MAKVSSQPLQPNPFATYRDPNTGLWLIVQGNAPKTQTESTMKENQNPCTTSAEKREG
jgi:hypothetical protein